MNAKTCCVTGHRNLPEDRIAYVEQELRREIRAAIANGYTHFISGFTEGTDLLFAAIIAEEKGSCPALSLEAAIPYRGRMKTHSRHFQNLLLFCDRVKIECENYRPSCYRQRNQYMVDQSQRVIAVYDGRGHGGTLSTMQYAFAHGKDVRVICL